MAERFYKYIKLLRWQTLRQHLPRPDAALPLMKLGASVAWWVGSTSKLLKF